MLTFKLISIKDGYYYYEIYPEGRVEDKGTVIFNPETKQVKTRVKPNSPFDCISMFFRGVSEKDGSLKAEGMVAWY